MSNSENLCIVKNYMTINRILEKHDPIGLMEAGCEEEEYSVEAIDIANRANLLEFGQLIAHITATFEFWFGDGCISYTQAKYIAEEIYLTFNK